MPRDYRDELRIMELKVWVEGIQRIVCGVTETTTCQEVVYALAHATAQSGRFTLVERWRSNERFLAPYEKPLTILMKWGEYSSDVQLILRRSNTDDAKNHNQRSMKNSSSHNTRTKGKHNNMFDSLSLNNVPDSENNRITHSTLKFNESPEGVKHNWDIRKSLTFSGLHGHSSEGNAEVQIENIAVVQPTSQLKTKDEVTRMNARKSADTSPRGFSGGDISQSPQTQVREVPSYKEPPGHDSSPYRVLPPYRDPPPPTVTRSSLWESTEAANDSYCHLEEGKSSPNHPKRKRNLHGDSRDPTDLMETNTHNNHTPKMVAVAYTQRYAELIALVNRQRDTINAQLGDLTKFDAEILYWENKNHEYFTQMDYISQEINRIESTGRMIDTQLNELVHTEEESELVRQQEKTLKSEITLLRSKLANCETELLQCKNKIRLVTEELTLEQHNLYRESEDRMLSERKIMNEMERLEKDVEQVRRLAEHSNIVTETLKQDVSNLEAAIVDKKQQVERLVTDMKDANLQSLTSACQDEQVKHFSEGAQKPGSTRKIIGSPRQLETAVPTSKNPHGVWV